MKNKAVRAEQNNVAKLVSPGERFKARILLGELCVCVCSSVYLILRVF
jgi:hypothetical protein